MIARQLFALLISRGPWSIHIWSWPSGQGLDALAKGGSGRPIVSVIIPTNYLPLGRISTCYIEFELQARRKYGLGKEFARVRRVELVPLVDPVAAMSQRITTCNQQLVIICAGCGLLMLLAQSFLEARRKDVLTPLRSRLVMS